MSLKDFACFAAVALTLSFVHPIAVSAEDTRKDGVRFTYQSSNSVKRQKSLDDAGYLSEHTLKLIGDHTLKPMWRLHTEASLYTPFENAGDNDRGFVLTEPEVGLILELAYGTDLKLGFDGGVTFGEEEFGTPVQRRRAITADREVIFVDYAPFGRLDVGTIGGAMGENCIEAPGALDVFGPADITTIGTCPGFAQDDTLLYTSPVFLGGWKIAASYTDDVREGRLDEEAASRTASAALVYSLAKGDNAINASLGVEKVFDFTTLPDHGQDGLVALQAGVSIKQGSWEWGVSTAFTAIDAVNENEWVFRFGTTYAATERLKLGTGLLYAQYGEIPEGASKAMPGSEFAASLAVNYKLVPDRVALEIGGSVLEKLEPVRKRDWQIGIGLLINLDTQLAGIN